MKQVSRTYNISYEMPDSEWKKLAAVYQQLPEFLGYDNSGIPIWYGREEDGGKHLCASVEPSGLLVEGMLEDEDWKEWDAAFTTKATLALGFDVKDADA